MLDFSTYPSITILGYGREWQSTYRFLVEQWYDPDWILVRDKQYEWILEHWGAIIAGDWYLEWIENDHCIWRAPGITTTMLAEQGVDIDSIRHKLISQTEYFLQHYTWTVIWVTGTKGKSTTSTMMMEMIRDAGKSVILAGNVGKPIFDLIDFNDSPEYIVYELSSYMLESLNQSDWTIDYGMITSLFPHVHVKEHGSQEAYISAKMEILKHSRKQFVGSQVLGVIQNAKFKMQNFTMFWYKWDSSQAQNDQDDQSSVTYYNWYFYQWDQKIFETSCVQLLWDHNLYNICWVIALWVALWISLKSIENTIANFHGLEHRLECVGIYQDITRYNDAIATTPDATLAAMKSFGEKLWTLFLGGIEGPYQFDAVVESCKVYNVSNVILFPDTWSRIQKLLQKSWYQGNIFDALSMEEAVQLAYIHTPAGKVALLSCGSPSFSLWAWFEEKGKLFKQAIIEKSQ
jgi:UDP-N-acetylmuramoyl-L-alanine---L-glutamate ligase